MNIKPLFKARNNSFHQTVNALSITIAPEEIREIEAVAEPVRASVRQMFERYKPNHDNGEEETNGSISMTYPRLISPILINEAAKLARRWLKLSYELRLRPFCRCGDFSILFLCGKDATPQTAEASHGVAAVLFEALLRRVWLKLCLNPSP